MTNTESSALSNEERVKYNIYNSKDELVATIHDKSHDNKVDMSLEVFTDNQKNLQFILQREIETGYIYGYEMIMSMIELEKKGSKLIRFNKFAKNTNKELLEMIINDLGDSISYSNKRKAYKIIYGIYKPDNLKEWFRKLF